ncbi:hypothetical protein MTR67_003692 [Solanum verrucosum]|uniref:SKP1 component dimerisation domain-containing protein n=1 Tax=Solanum verrucosum TaxID=315347 RepID=A0AAF0PT90_SOLVR|nr:hypothetical protein MTR67_003692 [Solanum verrucosum]
MTQEINIPTWKWKVINMDFITGWVGSAPWAKPVLMALLKRMCQLRFLIVRQTRNAEFQKLQVPPTVPPTDRRWGQWMATCSSSPEGLGILAKFGPTPGPADCSASVDAGVVDVAVVGVAVVVVVVVDAVVVVIYVAIVAVVVVGVGVVVVVVVVVAIVVVVVVVVVVVIVVVVVVVVTLLHLTCVADLIKGKTPEEIRKTFNIKNDFMPKEEEEVRKENA